MIEGKLLAIWARKEWGGEMSRLDAANLVEGKGMVEDVSFGSRRQITIIEEEAWTTVMRQLGSDLPPETRRANLLVSGINLKETRGQILKIGDCRIKITGETKPCAAMDAKVPGLRKALKPDWRGGAVGKVLSGGQIPVGAQVVWEDAEAE